MLLGEFPGLALDRTGAALLGAIVLVATELMSPQQAWSAIDTPTLCLLFGLMVVSAQLRLGGFYDQVTRRIAAAPLAPDALLAVLVAVAGLLSALLANDIVCLAMAPILIESCGRRRLRPLRRSCSPWRRRPTSARPPRSSAIRRTCSSADGWASRSPATSPTPGCRPPWGSSPSGG